MLLETTSTIKYVEIEITNLVPIFCVSNKKIPSSYDNGLFRDRWKYVPFHLLSKKCSITILSIYRPIVLFADFSKKGLYVYDILVYLI